MLKFFIAKHGTTGQEPLMQEIWCPDLGTETVALGQRLELRTVDGSMVNDAYHRGDIGLLMVDDGSFLLINV